jgi:hypothetical protein
MPDIQQLLAAGKLRPDSGFAGTAQEQYGGQQNNQPIRTSWGVADPGFSSGQPVSASSGIQAQPPMSPAGVSTTQQPPSLSSFSQGDLYRNVGNNAGLSQALMQMDPNYHQNVNAYNSGSGFASQADFLNNLNSSQQAGKQLNQMYNTGYDPTQGITSIADMKRLGLWG